jgi:hypothetical protein
MTVNWEPLNGIEAALIANGYLNPSQSMEFPSPFYDSNNNYVAHWFIVMPKWAQATYPQSVQIEAVRVRVTGPPNKIRAFVKVKNTAPLQVTVPGANIGCDFDVWAVRGWV